jgi:hypothetical protein
MQQSVLGSAMEDIVEEGLVQTEPPLLDPEAIIEAEQAALRKRLHRVWEKARKAEIMGIRLARELEFQGQRRMQLANSSPYMGYTHRPWRYKHQRGVGDRSATWARQVAKQGQGRKKHKPSCTTSLPPINHTRPVTHTRKQLYATIILTLLWFSVMPTVEAGGALQTLGALAAYLQPRDSGTTAWQHTRLPASFHKPARKRHTTTSPVAQHHIHSITEGGGSAEAPVHGRPPDTRPHVLADYDATYGIDTSGELRSLSAIRTFLPEGETTTPDAERYEKCPDSGMHFGKHKLTNKEQRARFKAMVMRHKHTAFAYAMHELPGYHGEMGPVKLEVISDTPVYSRARRQSQLEKDISDKKCIEMRDAGIIEPNPKSRYASSPIIAAKKAPDGTWSDTRYCIDYRGINLITAPHHTHAPVADELFQELGKSVFYSKLDLRSGFFQIPIHPDSRPLTSFWWAKDLWQYKRAPFGLRALPQIFQGIMDHEIQTHGLSAFTKCFIDDLLIHSDTFEEHLKHVEQVLEMLEHVGLRAHDEKALFMSQEVEFLGFMVSSHGLTASEAKIKALTDMPYPRDLVELRTALGKLRYYGCFCENFSQKARPMLDLLKKDVRFQWTAEQGASFDVIRAEISQPGKALQRFDPTKPIFVHCDFSNVGLGAVLSQTDDAGNEYMVACVSRSLNKHEKNYSSYKGECLGAVWAVKIFKHFLHGRKFTLVTDHEPLKWLMASATLEGAHARWACILQEYDFTIVHRPGKDNANADALSRLPQGHTTDTTGARLDHDTPATPDACAITHAALVLEYTHSMQLDTIGGSASTSVTQLDTRPNPQGLERVVHEGIVLYEPFGGLAAGLEALLRNNIQIHQYIYSDTSPIAQAIAKHRIASLHYKYPLLLPMHAIQHTFTSLPMDVSACTHDALRHAGAGSGRQWVVIAGPPCQSFSPAGKHQGLEGQQGDAFMACVQLVGALQQVQHRVPPLFLIENAAMQFNFRSAFIRDVVFPQVCTMIGYPVTIDAVRFGSHAHRLRNFWQNWAPVQSVHAKVSNTHRSTGQIVDNILDPGRSSAWVEHTDRHPFYQVNLRGEPRRALPTLVAYPQSIAFKHPHSAGSVYDSTTGRYGEPNPDERERALGYYTGATAAPGVTEADRHQVTGNCMDMASLVGLIHILLTHAEHGAMHCQHVHTLQCAHVPAATPVLPACMLGSDVACYAATLGDDTTPLTDGGKQAVPSVEPVQPHVAFVGNKRMARQISEPHQKDIHYDADTLTLLRTGRLPDGLADIQKRRVTRRAQSYHIAGGSPPSVFRTMPNGTFRVVPAPSDRLGIIEKAHVLSGHFGIRRTMHLMLTNYWWQGIWKDVTEAVNNCKVCDRVKASFNAHHPELHSLPIEGLFYRWGVDLCGPFPETKRGYKYVMIMVEHFSKTLVLEPLTGKEPRHTAYAFEHGVLGRFGACAELITDRGTEFAGEFQAMMASNFIDHRQTSPNHPQADGLAERCVQTVKRGLRRYCESVGVSDTWDDHLAYISMGYNCSKQMSTNVSPFQVLYAREPQFPSEAVRERMGVTIAFDDPDTQALAAQELLLRGEYLKRNMPIIANNLAIAQHRDKLRYAQIRSGTYMPLIRKFSVGDYVYLRRPNVANTLQMVAKQVIARVLEVRESGVIILQGKCGNTLSTHVSNLAPCHLPHMDGSIDPELAIPQADHACEGCGFPDGEDRMLLCDFCNNGWHTYCLTPTLCQVPEGDWLCPACTASGITQEQVAAAQPSRIAGREAQAADPTTVIFANKAMRARDLAASAYGGRLVCKRITTKQGLSEELWGAVTFRGADFRPVYFDIQYDNHTHEILGMRGLKNRHVMPAGTIRPSLVTSTICIPALPQCIANRCKHIAGHPAHTRCPHALAADKIFL